jgi:DNA-binding phage protein
MAFKRIENLTDPVLTDPKRRANVERERREAVGEIIAHNLAELRRAREVTQVEVARTLHRGQSSVSALEHSADPHLSTLREYIEAIGGRLEITAVFDEERVPLDL